MSAAGIKWLTAARLGELLGSLRPDTMVSVGGRLVIVSPDTGLVGYIDFDDEGSVVLFPPDPPPIIDNPRTPT